MSRRGRRGKRDAGEPPLPAWPGTDGSGWVQELVATLVRLFAGRALFIAGVALAGLGGTLLSSAWRLGPQSWLEHRGRGGLTARAEVRAVRPFWRIGVDRDPFGDGVAWPSRARVELCAELVPVEPDRLAPLLACGARRRGAGPWGFVETAELAPGAPVVWPRDGAGWPRIELRAAPEVLAALRAKPVDFWPLLGQSEEARAAMTAGGSEWDALWLEVDRPLEWWVRSASAPDEARFEVAFDPDAPERALPAALLEAPAAGDFPTLALVLLAVGGGLAWWKGIGFAFAGLPRWAIVLAQVGPLLVLPWWGDRLAEVVRRLAPGVGEVGLVIAADLDEAGRPPVEMHPLEFAAALERSVWTIGTSYYGELLAPFELVAPRAPGDPDRALASAGAAIAARLRALEPGVQVATLRRLAWEEQLDRGEVGLLFAGGACELLEDPEGDPAVRAAAGSFLFWLGVTPIGLDPEQPAFAARRAIWERLAGATDPAVHNTASAVLERLAAPR